MHTVRKGADKLISALSLLLGLLLLFLPMVMVFRFQQGMDPRDRGTEVAVGVAVILRTTFRRLLRSGSTNVLRTSLGAFSRTSARTMTRRMVRTSTRYVLGVLAVRSGDSSDEETETNARATVFNWISLGLGAVALALSFAYVATHPRSTDGEVPVTLTGIGRYSMMTLSILAACPLVLYAAAAYTVARHYGSNVRVRTAVDGLLLQAYFSGASSFLPMTTDIEITGDERTQYKVSTWVIIILYAVHLALYGISAQWDFQTGTVLAAFVLIYCFVYSFPIPPLQGFWIWKQSKVVWLLVWIPILISFVKTLPKALVNLL